MKQILFFFLVFSIFHTNAFAQKRTAGFVKVLNESNHQYENSPAEADADAAISKTLSEKVFKYNWVLIDLGARWCGGCQAIKGEVEKFAKKHPHVKVYSLDLDDSPRLSKKLCKVYGTPKFNGWIPHLFFFKHGKIVDDFNTLASGETLETKFSKLKRRVIRLHQKSIQASIDNKQN